MATPEKDAAIAEMTDKFRNSSAAVLTEYRGLTVAQLSQLRSSMREHATYAVVKNTLTKRAAAEAGITGFDEHLQGPSAIAFITGDPVEAAKGLRDFAKANPELVIKAGLLDGKPLSVAEISKLADLESRETLLAKLAGAMNASLTQAVYLFAAPLSQTARVVDALRAKVEQEAPAAEPPAVAAPTTAEPSTDESAPAGTATAEPSTDESAPAGTATDESVPAGEATAEPSTDESVPAGEATAEPSTDESAPADTATDESVPAGEATAESSTDGSAPAGAATDESSTDESAPAGEATTDVAEGGDSTTDS